MKKIQTIFERDWSGDRSRVTPTRNPAAAWVFHGEGVATQKLDGTSCMIRDGVLLKRRELKAGLPEPDGFISEGTDGETGKTVGWVPRGSGRDDVYHAEAFDRLLQRVNGTYELIGPMVQGNPEHASVHLLVPHNDPTLVISGVPRDYTELAAWFAGKDIEGIVWRHPDGRMGKIKMRDFGLKRFPVAA